MVMLENSSCKSISEIVTVMFETHLCKFPEIDMYLHIFFLFFLISEHFERIYLETSIQKYCM